MMLVPVSSSSTQLPAIRAEAGMPLVLAMVMGLIGVLITAADVDLAFSVGKAALVMVKMAVAVSIALPAERARTVKLLGLTPVSMPVIAQARAPVATAMVRPSSIRVGLSLSPLSRKWHSVMSAPSSALSMVSAGVMSTPSVTLKGTSPSGRLGGNSLMVSLYTMLTSL